MNYLNVAQQQSTIYILHSVSVQIWVESFCKCLQLLKVHLHRGEIFL